MPKKSLTSLELAALINELQPLVKSRISQIYHQDQEFLFQLHTQQGKQFLRLLPGQILNLTENKNPSTKPTNFCMQLRKHLNNAFIRKIYQKDTERILILEIEKKETYLLIIELFAPGNLVLTNQKLLTIAALHQKKFKDRFIRPKTKYIFPSQNLNWKTLTGPQLKKILQKSQKKNLATSLATEIGFGGLYAEEICKINDLNKNQPPKETKDSEIKTIIKTIKDFIKKIETPAGFFYPDQITPFPLKDQTSIKKIPTYNQAIDTLKPIQKESPYQKKINTLKRILQEQQDALQKQETLIELNNQKAEHVYQHYQPLQKLLQIVKSLKLTKTWPEIEQELQKEKKIKKIDLKNKKIIIDL